MKPVKLYSDYQLKSKILRSVSGGNATVSRIFDNIEYKNTKNCLRKELYQLWKFGVLLREWREGEYHYRLSSKGEFLLRFGSDYYARNRQKLINDAVQGILTNDVRFNQAVQEYAQLHPEMVVVNGGNTPITDSMEEIDRLRKENEEFKREMSFNSLKDYPYSNLSYVKKGGSDTVANVDNEHQKELRDVLLPNLHSSQPPKDDVIRKMTEENLRLKEKIKELELEKFAQINYGVRPPVYLDAKTGNELSSEQVQDKRIRYQQKQAEYNERANKRRMLARRYDGYSLDPAFFREWGVVRPRKIKHFGFLKPGSIEIISAGNEEIARRHVKEWLSDKEILQAKFYIQNYAHNGIVVFGYGMRIPQLLKYQR